MMEKDLYESLDVIYASLDCDEAREEFIELAVRLVHMWDPGAMATVKRWKRDHTRRVTLTTRCPHCEEQAPHDGVKILPHRTPLGHDCSGVNWRIKSALENDELQLRVVD